jgi:hypothetical protein
LGSDDTDPNEEEEDDDDDDEVVVLGEPTEGVPPVARAPVASVSVRSPFAGHSVIAPSVRQPGTLVAPPVVSYCWNPLQLKTVYTDFDNVDHQFVAILLPSGVGVDSAQDFRLFMTYYGPDQYLNLQVQWPDTFEKDDGAIFLQFLNSMQLETKDRKWLNLKTCPEYSKVKNNFESSFVMLCMAVKQEMIRMRNSKGTTVLQSQTSVKMDFPVERLTYDSWELIGDPDTGVRMVVVDLERATPREEYNQAPHERVVRMIGEANDD